MLRAHLPPSTTSLLLDAADNGFVGRARLLEDVPRTLRRGRSVVLVGCPGVGKTRLAAECLRALSDEPMVVGSLGDVRDRRGLIGKVAEAIGLWLAPALTVDEVEERVTAALSALGPPSRCSTPSSTSPPTRTRCSRDGSTRRP